MVVLGLGEPDSPRANTVGSGSSPAYTGKGLASKGAVVVTFYNNLDVIPRPYTQVDRSLSDTASSYLINFATSGDPNGTGLSAWPAFDRDTGRVLYLGESIAVGPVPRKDAPGFFDAFYAAAR